MDIYSPHPSFDYHLMPPFFLSVAIFLPPVIRTIQSTGSALPVDHTALLPAETLAAIFLIVVEDFFDEDWVAGGHFGSQCIYFNITSICRRWRSIARSYPSLWSKISIRLGLLSTAYLDDHIRCSRSAPLRIQILEGQRLVSASTVEGVIVDLLSVADRWSTFSFNDRLWAYGPPIYSAIAHYTTLSPVAFPQLRSIAMVPAFGLRR